MTDDKQQREINDRAAALVKSAGKTRIIGPLTDDAADGGDPVCWAHLVCDECGAITSEGHRAGCSRQERDDS